MFPRGQSDGIDRTPIRPISRQVPRPDRPATQPHLHPPSRRRSLRARDGRRPRPRAVARPRPAHRSRSPSGQRRSCRCVDDWSDRARPPTSATCVATCCRGFGDYRLGFIPAEEIELWLNDEIDAGIAPSSVHRHYRTLRRLLQVACDKDKIVANPCDRVTPPRVPKRRWSSSTGTKSSSWPYRTATGTRRSFCSRSRPACAGANWSGCVAPAST